MKADFSLNWPKYAGTASHSRLIIGVPGISTVAAPIFMNDAVFASIGMSIPTERSSDEKISQMSSLVLNAAIQISEILGASPDADPVSVGEGRPRRRI